MNSLSELILYVFFAIILLIIAWAIISIPVYISAKFFAGRKATFGAAMAAVLLGIIVSSIVYYVFYFLLNFLVGRNISPLPDIAAFFSLLAVYKSEFRTGWLGAFGIAILSALIWILISFIASFYISSIIPFAPPGKLF